LIDLSMWVFTSYIERVFSC